MAVLRNGRPLKWPLSIMTVIQKKNFKVTFFKLAVLENDRFQSKVGGKLTLIICPSLYGQK